MDDHFISVASASELLENVEEQFPRYNINTDVTIWFISSITYWRVTRRDWLKYNSLCDKWLLFLEVIILALIYLIVYTHTDF